MIANDGAPPDADTPPPEPLPPARPGQARDVFQTSSTGPARRRAEDLFLHHTRYAAAQDPVRQAIRTQGPLSAAAFKELLDTSRRYAIPLLQHFDEVGLTRREGDVRVLREG